MNWDYLWAEIARNVGVTTSSIARAVELLEGGG